MQHCNLETIAGGTLTKKVNRALEEVAKNIMDPNTDPKAKRKIKVTMTFSGKERSLQHCGISVETVLAPEVESLAVFGFGKDLKSGEVDCIEVGNQIPGQLSFADYEDNEPIRGYDAGTGEIFEVPPVELRRAE